jgi:arginine/ornithine transport system substrate-binding protein
VNTVRAFVCAFAIMAAPGAVGAKDWSHIRIGVEGAYPPFSAVTADGTLVGFDIDIANALCAQMNARCTLVQQDWDGMIPALLARKYDAIVASMSMTEERRLKVDFTRKYYQTPARFVRRKGSGIEISKAGLDGRTVGVQRATTHDNFVSGQFGDAVIIKRYASQDEAYLDAVAGRVDLLLADSVALQEGFIATAAGQDWEFTGPGYTDVKYFGDGVGIAVRKGEPALLKKFDDAIDAIRANGSYKSINDKYFRFDVYGG